MQIPYLKCEEIIMTSERAFGDYLMIDARKKLMQAYKHAGIKRFHDMNAGTLEYTHVKWLVSYYTYIVGTTDDTTRRDGYMFVSPFVFLKEYSQTTNKQANRWLKENGFEFTIQELEHVYDNAIHGIASEPLTRCVDDITTYVLPLFNHHQTYLNDSWPNSHQKAIDRVPWLKYDEHQDSLVRVGWAINDGNTYGVKYD